jgi:sigma-B regulation protein RsbQ
MIFTSSAGHKVFYSYSNNADKPVLLLCNGIGQNSSYWAEIKFLFKNDYSFLEFDFPNQGQSSHTRKPLATNEYAEILLELCSELNLEKCVGIGNAFGGLIIKLAYQIKPSLFNKIVLISCFAQRNKRMGRYAENTKSIVESIVQEQDFLKLFGQDWLDKSFIEMFGSEYLSTRSNQKKSERYFKGILSMMNSLQASENNITSEVEKIKIPVLVIQGALDQIIPPSNGIELTEKLAKGQYAEIKNGKHILQQTHPDELADELRSFLV